jgi:hypothetical protein
MRRIYSLVILIFVEVTCRHNGVAAANDAACEATSEACEPGVGEENNMLTSWEFMNAFSKLGTSWNHVIGECTCTIYTLVLCVCFLSYNLAHIKIICITMFVIQIFP